MAYIAVNAESLRKQLHINKKEFYRELKNNASEDLTSFVENRLKTHQYQEPKRKKDL
ncbi:MAG: hypothetical protein HWD61_05470 [Parachlamydiaceae bacterium]|nr:MAG: hypothetical protein HWD61_05470 [Parachlamydiaceae bacterium]